MEKNTSIKGYFQGIQQLFEVYANAEEQQDMEKYMRNQFIFYGIRSPIRKALQKKYCKENGYPAIADLPDFIDLCWNTKQREFQYTGMEIAGKLIKKVPESFLPVLEKMVVQQSWWDTVDWIASNLVGVHLQRFPALNPAYPDQWIQAKNLWLNRIALLFQLKYKKNTNAPQLFSYIRRFKDSEEFFIQKAAGWALRQYSKYNEVAVLDFVQETHLPKLTEREALKYISK